MGRDLLTPSFDCCRRLFIEDRPELFYKRRGACSSSEIEKYLLLYGNRQSLKPRTGERDLITLNVDLLQRFFDQGVKQTFKIPKALGHHPKRFMSAGKKRE